MPRPSRPAASRRPSPLPPGASRVRHRRSAFPARVEARGVGAARLLPGRAVIQVVIPVARIEFPRGNGPVLVAATELGSAATLGVLVGATIGRHHVDRLGYATEDSGEVLHAASVALGIYLLRFPRHRTNRPLLPLRCQPARRTPGRRPGVAGFLLAATYDAGSTIRLAIGSRP